MSTARTTIEAMNYKIMHMAYDKNIQILLLLLLIRSLQKKNNFP
jgi:hypothetical protein